MLHGRAQVVLGQQEGQGGGLEIRLQTQEWRNRSVLLWVHLMEKIYLLVVRYLKRENARSGTEMMFSIKAIDFWPKMLLSDP